MVELQAPAPLRLWRIALDILPDDAALRTLSDAEWQRAQRFHFDRDRRRYLAAHVALRQILGRELGHEPRELRFGLGPFGKPFLLNHPRCSFNLSDSGEVAVVAIAPQGEIGVDVECPRAVSDCQELSLRNFTPAEYEQLLHTTAKDRDLAFLRCWTRKEACLKALGSGLSIAPQTFHAGVGPERREVLIPTAGGMTRIAVESLTDQSGLVLAVAQIVIDY